MYFIVYVDDHDIVGLTDDIGCYKSERPVVYVSAAGLLPEEAKIMFDGRSYWATAKNPPQPGFFARMFGGK